MKSQFLLALVASLFVSGAPAEPLELPLWPDGTPDEPASFKPGDPSENTLERIAVVTEPSLTLYPAPQDKANGAAILVCPGGGYHILAWNKEGLEVAEWLNSIGVTAAVLKYRVPRREKDDAWPWPLQDAQRAIRLLRHHAADWKIDPDRIGVLGFSAGGHLTVMTGVKAAEPAAEKLDDASTQSARPNFLLPIYAAYLTQPAGRVAFSPEIVLTEDFPPTFLAVTQDDKSRGADAAKLFIELTRLGVPAEAHLYTQGGHGYGLRPSEDPVNSWPDRAADWLRRMGYLAKD